MNTGPEIVFLNVSSIQDGSLLDKKLTLIHGFLASFFGFSALTVIILNAEMPTRNYFPIFSKLSKWQFYLFALCWKIFGYLLRS